MISIIVPIYNSASSLKECIESVKTQSVSDWELILIDDGSTDSSLDICRAMADGDDRIKVFHQENAGVVAARNKGISESSGEWIAFLDSDDWLSPNYINVLYNNILKEEQVDIIWFNVNEKHKTSTIVIKYKESNDLIYDLLTTNKHGWLWNKIYKRKFLESINLDSYPNCGIMEDAYILVQIYSQCPRIKYIDAAIYNYNCCSSVSATRSLNVLGRAYRNIINIYIYLENKNQLKSYKKEVYNLLLRSKIERFNMGIYQSESPRVERNILNYPLKFPINIKYWVLLNIRIVRTILSKIKKND